MKKMRQVHRRDMERHGGGNGKGQKLVRAALFLRESEAPTSQSTAAVETTHWASSRANAIFPHDPVARETYMDPLIEIRLLRLEVDKINDRLR